MRRGALITGAGRGLGLEIARALAARGLTVHLTDSTPERPRRRRGDRRRGLGSALDVRDAEACRAAAAATLERAGRSTSGSTTPASWSPATSGTTTRSPANAVRGQHAGDDQRHPGGARADEQYVGPCRLNSSYCLTKFRWVNTRLNFELLQRVNRWQHDIGIEVRVRVVDPIERVVVKHHSLSADRDRLICPVPALPRTGLTCRRRKRGDVWSQCYQLQIVAPV